MPRANVKDKRKQQLMQATLDSIAKRGLTETTITHISKGAGMSRGIINFYFTSKEMMMQETLQWLLEEYEAAWRSALERADDTEQGALNALIDVHFSKKLCYPKRLNVLTAFWGHAAAHAPYREQFDKSDAKLQDALATAWKKASPRGFGAEQFARQVHALIRGMWLSFLLGGKEVTREGLNQEAMEFVNRHLQPVQMVRGEPVAEVKPEQTEVKAPAAAAPKPVAKPMPPVSTPSASKKKAKQRDVLDGQMDIEDLFASAN